MIEWLPWLPSKSCYTNLKFFETLKDTPNPSKGFRFVAFLVLEILGGGGSFSTPPWCLVWVPKPLVPGGLKINLDGEKDKLDAKSNKEHKQDVEVIKAKPNIKKEELK